MIKNFGDIEEYRIKEGEMAEPDFEVKHRRGTYSFMTCNSMGILVVADAGDDDSVGWERISITVQTLRRVKGKKSRQIVDRAPSHVEILQIKDVFWLPTEEVIQVYGKGIGDPRCLTVELWRKKNGEMTIPYGVLVEDNNKSEKESNAGNNKRTTGTTASDAGADKIQRDRSPCELTD